MNVDTGRMATMDEVMAAAKPGERVIPATVIPPPPRKRKYSTEGSPLPPRAPVYGPPAPVYGPRQPLREVRAALRAREAQTQ